MTRSIRTFPLMAAAGLLALALLAPTAQAQFRAGGRVPNTVGIQGWRNVTRVNPNPYLGNGLTLNQWAYNTAVMGRAYSTIPPYALGYNPYPSVVNYGPVYPVTTPAYNPYLAYTYSPTVYNPYAYGYGLNMVNPYLP